MGIEPTMPLLSQSIIGFEDRGRHQSGTRFHPGTYKEIGGTPTGSVRQRRGQATGRILRRIEEVMRATEEFAEH